MEISRDALMRVVKATRMANRLAKDTQAMLMVKCTETVADIIADLLADCLFEFIDEDFGPEKDFCNESVTMKLIESELSDSEVTDYILHRAELPKPVIRDLDETRMMFEKNGGYQYAETPEGEWHGNG